MCGICGHIRFDGLCADTQLTRRMMDAMASRGPDAAGMVLRQHAALGHRRLKIIDLSEKAQQPMVDSDLGLTIVFNGALYNYRELRATLENMNYRFFSNGDTEVILKSYHAWGTECVARFNGMFAFAVLCRDTGRVFLARDRLGIKPLYYLKTGHDFAFASFLPALLVHPQADTRIDPAALNYYMTLHAVVPAPHTIFQGIRKLPPATSMTLDPDGRTRTRRYWQLSFGARREEKNNTFEDWRQKLELELEAAVRRRLTADVPVGVLLSGGLDSSLIVALLAAGGQTGLNTFSIGFDTVDEKKGDEFNYSDLIAETFQTEHHKIRADDVSVLKYLPDAVAAMSEPMVSHDCIGFYLLSQRVSRHVKVVQSGQGAD